MATFRRVGTIQTFRDKMIEGMAAKGYDRDFAERCFRQIEGFGEYGFPESHAASFALLVYASCWMKCRYPDVFAAAMLNSQPLGFYAPAQLVRDAREHGVEVREVDVNLSDWDCTLEALPPLPLAGKGQGVRAAHPSPRARGEGRGEGRRRPLRQKWRSPSSGRCAATFSPRTGEGIHPPPRLDGRPYPHDPCGASRPPADRRGQGGRHAPARRAAGRRATIPCATSGCAAASTPAALEQLADADAFRSLGLDRRQALWAVRGLDRVGDQDDLPLFAAREPSRETEPDAKLPPMPLGAHVVEDYRRLSLSLKAHPTSFMRARLAARGILRSDALASVKSGERVTVAGLVLVRQRPGTAKGVIFMTLEDETGVANVIVWPKAFERLRAIVLGARFVAVTGKLQNEQGVIHVVADRMEDLTPMLGLLSEAGETIDGDRPRRRGPPAADCRWRRSGRAIASPSRRGSTIRARRPISPPKSSRRGARCRRDGISGDPAARD